MKYINPDGSIFYEGTLERNKEEAHFEISQNFLETGKTNIFICSFGFPIDNRWIEKNDIDNASIAIDTWFEHMDVCSFRDANNQSQTLTLEQLKQLKKEGQFNRLYILSTKWQREYLIDSAETNEQVWAFVEMSNEQINSFFPPLG